MAQTNFTPIQLYRSTTASAVPSAANLAAGELALNLTDGRLFYEDNLGAVQIVGAKMTAAIATFLGTPSSANLIAAVTDETGTGALVFGTGPSLTSASVGIIAGSVSAPGLFISGDTNTGIWSPGADTLAVSTGANEALRVDSAQRVLIGHTSAVSVSSLNMQAQSHNASGYGFGSIRWSADASGSSIVVGKSRSASIGTQSALSSADVLGNYAFAGSDGSSLFQAVLLRAVASEAWTGSAHGTNLDVYTTPTGSTTVMFVARFAQSGNLLIGTTTDNGTDQLQVNGSAAATGNIRISGTGGLGYATGSGGTVTQATSRTTGVTLNKTNGAITLVSAAGSATFQSFTVTNSTVAATDTVLVSQKSGTDLYEIHVTAVAAGSFRITFRTTGGTTTEQPVFSFAVLKAVTA